LGHLTRMIQTLTISNDDRFFSITVMCIGNKIALFQLRLQDMGHLTRMLQTLTISNDDSYFSSTGMCMEKEIVSFL
jgi:pyridoxal/pyridoxine/pyridoxamine kinase